MDEIREFWPTLIEVAFEMSKIENKWDLLYRRFGAAVERAIMSLGSIVLKILTLATSSISLIHTEADKIKELQQQHFTRLSTYLSHLFYSTKKGKMKKVEKTS